MIIDDIAERLTAALEGNTAAALIDLTWNISINPIPLPDGRAAISAQFILSCASLTVGRREWDIVDVPVEQVLVDDAGMRQIAFDIVQRMTAIRQLPVAGLKLK